MAGLPAIALPIAQMAPLVAAAAGGAWYVREKSLRRTHAMPGGLQPGITLPHTADFELWHNAFSLCSKKVRMCLAELGIEHASHHVDLIETGSYETISRRFLAVNPAGLVPVLVHRGHPVYESHEIIRYAAQHSPLDHTLVPRDPHDAATMDEWVRRSSLTGDDPIEVIGESAGNCVPGLTVPLFAAMIAFIPARRIAEGLLFHPLKKRPAFFLAMKVAGLARIPSMAPVVDVIRRSHEAMNAHLDALERHLAAGGGRRAWIAGEAISLADLSWAVIFERLREADWTGLASSPARRPHVERWWRRVQDRASFHASMRGRMEHPLVARGTVAIVERKATDDRFRRVIYDQQDREPRRA